MNDLLDGSRAMRLDDQFPGYEEEFGLPDEPRSFQAEDFERLLEFATEVGASDITLQTEEPVYAYIEGRNLRLTKRSLSAPELDRIAMHIYGSNAVAVLRSANDIDCRHTVAQRGLDGVGNNVIQRKLGFRVNVTACWARGSDNGMQITCRTIQPTPPRLDDLGIEAVLREALFPDQGMVLVCGPTGSGKTTLLAALVREIVEDANCHKKIITLESPIEFTWDEIPRASAIVSQHEIPRHIKSFAAGVRNTLRRAPKIILVGESRDSVTVEAALEAANTGHTLYTTMHTNNVPQTISRAANMFPPNERMTKVFEIIESLRMVVVQRLVRRADGKGRVALREFLEFDQTVRDHLRVVQSLREVEHTLSRLVEKRGQSMLSAAQRAFDAGLIGASAMNIFERESKSALLEDLGMNFGS